MSIRTERQQSAVTTTWSTNLWTLVIPVKTLADAKSRLQGAMTPAQRRDLVLTMLSSVLRCCAEARTVGTYLVLTADPAVTALAQRLGADVLSDDTPGDHPDPLNWALASVLPQHPIQPIGVVTADLPKLTPDLLDVILTSASHYPHSIVSDHLGQGTTMALWSAQADSVIPRFGPESAKEFCSQGHAVDLVSIIGVLVEPARNDVDTPDDVHACGLWPLAVAAD